MQSGVIECTNSQRSECRWQLHPPSSGTSQMASPLLIVPIFASNLTVRPEDRE